MNRFLPLILAAAAAGCSSVDERLYEPGDPPRLRDGTITMRTHWAPGDEKKVDIRRIKSRDGAVTCELISPDRGHFAGDVPEDEWRALWNRLLATDPFGTRRMSVDPDDPQGGPYHHVRLELGRSGSEFSAQDRKNLLIFSSRDVAEKLGHSGAIADVVTRHATRSLAEPKPSPPPDPPAKK